MIILRIDYGTYIAVPEEILPYLPKCVRIKEAGDAFIKCDDNIEVIICDKEIQTGDSALAVKLTKAEAEAARNLKWYQDEKAKVTALEKANG